MVSGRTEIIKKLSKKAVSILLVMDDGLWVIMFTAATMNLMVSILLVMDDGLWEVTNETTGNPELVSILLVMDDGLWESILSALHVKKNPVSILLVMDDGLWDRIDLLGKKQKI